MQGCFFREMLFAVHFCNCDQFLLYAAQSACLCLFCNATYSADFFHPFDLLSKFSGRVFFGCYLEQLTTQQCAVAAFNEYNMELLYIWFYNGHGVFCMRGIL